MKRRADRLVSIAEDALELLRRDLAAAIASRDRAANDVAFCKEGQAAARAERDVEIAAGVNEVAFAELDAWLRSHDGRVTRAERALATAVEAVHVARSAVERGLVRLEQMRILRERSLEAESVKEAKADRRAEDERLAHRPTTK